MYRAWAEINTKALENNLALARRLSGRKVMCVIKGNAHGHGALECAKVLEKAGADAFGVACFSEGAALRDAGSRLPILVFGYTDPALVPQMIEKDLIQSGFEPDYAKALSDAAGQYGGVLKIHAKIDTGMSRTGLSAQDDPKKAADAVTAMAALPHLEVCGIFTHFAAADMPAKDGYTAWQLDNFQKVLKTLKDQGFDTDRLLKHAGNSACILYHPEVKFDMVRAGVMMYGFYPNGVWDPDGPLDPVLSLCARVAQVKEIPAGTSVSYGCTFTSDRPMKIAAVCAGYADSYPRVLSNKGAWAVINGHKCRQIGRVCMDMTLFDVTGLDVKQGDKAILYGRGGMPLDELARLTGSINCEATCLITDRVERVYI
ncbi:MAG: alanine racemase [Clostridia bacterium]|nr:alanine racemase [Clostridia bacterium]